MTKLRSYEMRLVSSHGADNEMIALDFELRRRDEEEWESWQAFVPTIHTSPFLNFLHSAFVCQLAYLKMNASERGVRLKHVHGACECETADFILTRFVTSFSIEPEGGEASGEDLGYLRERCLACPVSRNLSHVKDKDAVVTLR